MVVCMQGNILSSGTLNIHQNSYYHKYISLYTIIFECQCVTTFLWTIKNCIDFKYNSNNFFYATIYRARVSNMFLCDKLKISMDIFYMKQYGTTIGYLFVYIFIFLVWDFIYIQKKKKKNKCRVFSHSFRWEYFSFTYM